MRPDPKQQTRQHPRSRQRRNQANPSPTHNQSQAPPHHQPQNIPSTRTQSHPYANLLCPLRHQKGHHPIKPNHRQHQSGQSKEPNQHSLKPRPIRQLAHPLLQRRNIDRQCRIQSRHLRANPPRHLLRRQRASHHNHRSAPNALPCPIFRPIPPQLVVLGYLLAGQATILYIGRNPNDRVPRSIGIADVIEVQSLPNWVFSGKHRVPQASWLSTTKWSLE